MKNYGPGKWILMLLSCVALLYGCNSARHSKGKTETTSSANTLNVEDSTGMLLFANDTTTTRQQQETTNSTTEQQGNFTITFMDSLNGAGKVIIKATDSSIEIDPGNRQIKSITGSRNKKQSTQHNNTINDSSAGKTQLVTTSNTHNSQDSSGQQTTQTTTSEKQTWRMPAIAIGIVCLFLFIGVWKLRSA